jgi:hypothetical protein
MIMEELVATPLGLRAFLLITTQGSLCLATLG